ncbi:MAG: HD domain-containing protein [Lachnospiraceae bacterium]|nr:HD domain-containing protein [Lachnospiraceae bacterium]
MTHKKNITVIFIVLTGIAINIAGKLFAVKYSLPLWMDSIGTAFNAYILGPVSGASVGISSSIIYAFLYGDSAVYGLVGGASGILIGLYARKGYFRTLFNTMTVSSLFTLLSILIALPINVFLYDGMIGNVWGDSVILLLKENSFPSFACYILGEFYIDFPDKFLTLISLYLVLRIRRTIWPRGGSHPDSGTDRDNISGGEGNQRTKGSPSKTILLLLILLLLPQMATPAYAASREADFYSYVQTTYDSENGLPCGEANDIAQTNDGVLWIGTHAGLFRYNGKEFRHMSEFPSVKNVRCLYEDNEGRLWIGTNDNGISLCINDKVTNVLNTNNGLSSNSIRSITQGADGCYYIGTSDALQILELNGGLQVLEQIPEIIYAQSITSDSSGHVAAVTSKGELYLIEDHQAKLKLTKRPWQEIYTCCLFAPDDTLYVGTAKNMVYHFALEDGALRFLQSYNFDGLQQINSLYISNDDTLFACANSGVGCLTNKGTYTKINLNEVQNSIEHMTQDYQGNYWFTSSRQGLLRLSKSSFTDVYGKAGLQRTVVNSITEWQNDLYVGTERGLDIIDLANNLPLTTTLSEELKGTRIRHLLSDNTKNLWISTHGMGLLCVSLNGSQQYFNYKNGMFDLVRLAIECSDGTILAAGDGGLAFIKDMELKKVIPFGKELCNARILCLLEREDGTILIGTDGDGLLRFKDGKKEGVYTESDGLTSMVILRVTKSKQGNGYYIVTSNGLCFMDNNGQIRPLKNFPYSNNYDIWSTPEGKLFISGSAGLYVANEKPLLAGSTKGYELLDSKRGLFTNLTENSWNYEDNSDHLYLSTSNGVYCLDLDHYRIQQHTYHTKLSLVKLDGVLYPVERGTPIQINRNTEKIEFLPEVISYALDDPYISYQLDGYDRNPTLVKRSELNSIVYNQIPSGEYTFRLRVLNDDQKLLEESTYHISKELMFHDHWWFTLYMTLVGGVAIIWFTWFFTRTRSHKTLRLQQKELALAREQVRIGNETILAIARTVDAKDENTSQHSQRVSDYSVLIAKEMGLNEKEVENLRRAALLHDIGKIGIPDSILKKPTALTDEEYDIMKSHVTLGAEILKDFTVVEHVVDGALYHHEKYNGTGYVSGLKGKDIPLYGRIIGVADAFDAMTQNRVYRKKLDLDYVLKELRRNRGTQFDPEITDIMLRLVAKGRITVNGVSKDEERTDL